MEKTDFTVKPSGSILEGNAAVVSITINSVNHAPVANDIRFTVDTNKPVDIILTGSDTDDDPITFEIVSNPLHGTLADFNSQKGIISYVANSDSSGSDSFTFKVSDIHDSESRVATAYITVKTDLNAMPVATDSSAATPMNVPVEIILKTTGTYVGDGLKFAVTSDPLHGKLRGFTNIDKTSAKVTYSPDKDYKGQDIFGFRAEDAKGGSSNIGHVSVQVIAPPPSPNSVPVAKSQSVTAQEDKKTRIVIEGTDVDEDELTFTLVSDPLHGKIISFDPPTGKLIYKPDTKFSGDDSFTFRITDPRDGVSNAAKVSIKIKSADNSPPNGMINRPVQNIPTKSDNKTTFVPSENRNHRPSVDAGPDHAVNEATTVDLVGSGKDKDRDKLSYSWKQILGPAVVLKGVDKPTSIFDVPDIDRDTLLQFSLTVDDGRGGQTQTLLEFWLRIRM